MYMLMFVLDDPQQLDPVLEAWEGLGVSGVTIVESTGTQRRKKQRARLPMRFSFEPPALGGEEGHFTLFAIVASDDMAQQCLQAVEGVLGDLDLPDTGVLAAWPLALVKGVPGKREAS